jgi:hypothetical protein
MGLHVLIEMSKECDGEINFFGIENLQQTFWKKIVFLIFLMALTLKHYRSKVRF